MTLERCSALHRPAINASTRRLARVDEHTPYGLVYRRTSGHLLNFSSLRKSIGSQFNSEVSRRHCCVLARVDQWVRPMLHAVGWLVDLMSEDKTLA